MKKTLKIVMLAMTASAVVATSAIAEDDIRLRLNWMYYGSHAGFAFGKDSGIYDKAGIDLDIRSGNGSSSAHRLVANGDSDFAYGSCGALINLASQGAEITSVAVIDAMGAEAVILRPDSGVSSVADLKGKTILTTANAGVNTFFPIVLANAGLTPDDVTITNVPDGALVSSYLQGSGGAVGILGGLDDKPAEIRANGGEDPVLLPYSDYGVDQVGYCISTRKELIEENPDLVNRFVDATIQAYKQTEADPDAAVNAIADIVGGTMAEDQGKAQSRAVLDVTLGLLYSGANQDKQLGLNVASDWESMVKLMKEYNDLDSSAKASDFYTNQFVTE
ncbi:MAG: ABC transporter substrate-binding protein [Roseibium album]|uniref:Putative thiamine biosynthesis protein n=1 Tax=Roseibium album TaxID=311410 RepID=A0A0M7A059_9HYPH|nr:ABC transporter substrate-binding protein [Roseibium album]MBG6142639.1 NitT/TauT family transport system substrate-binding protein [Labrenzia sp. EL_142]MBG6159286.1 NitT/TauT family transport system substrate-binding protein [Labrenzia sp. EL_162]MBG6165490.1 NitT/TauT family transport system substrate-binding protein [Labrenzia sp. EL_195]MBG6177650.1 NitT/TauT family transport system substrate-binding protein [Labrenzia sp. EL_132]MBG6197626.1 NitT/TauT family transport system substrate